MFRLAKTREVTQCSILESLLFFLRKEFQWKSLENLNFRKPNQLVRIILAPQLGRERSSPICKNLFQSNKIRLLRKELKAPPENSIHKEQDKLATNEEIGSKDNELPPTKVRIQFPVDALKMRLKIHQLIYTAGNNYSGLITTQSESQIPREGLEILRSWKKPKDPDETEEPPQLRTMVSSSFPVSQTQSNIY
ncbi:hypothetical protein QE152_g31937 [Popillia japonica]|uniref:Uncharacterized protein n=1 Tax=Popillia japonica TaxID=7064 RepID=A0AAW1J0B7_POPJA